MKTSFSAVLILLLVPAMARAQVAVEADARGVARVLVGGVDVLKDVGVAVVKPGWKGDLANQRTADPSEVSIRKEGDLTTYVIPLHEPFAGVLIERIVRQKDEVRLEFEAIPDEEAEIEAVVLRGALETAEHAGKTSYFIGDDEAPHGVLPPALDAEHYVVWGGRPRWIGFEKPEEQGLRIDPGDARIQIQDDRKWNAPHFSLMAMTSGGEVLARKPIRISLAFKAQAAGVLAKEANASGVAAGSDDRPLAIADARLDRDRVDVFAPVTIDLDVHARYENPFDPDQITVDAEVVAPDGRKTSVPGYYQSPFQLERTDRAETLKPAGPGGFRVKYSPVVAGRHSMTIKVKDASGEVRSKPLMFTAVASKSPGFIRVAEKAPHYFRFDDGSSYFAVGENVCWANDRNPLESYENWFGALGKAGGNWARLWLAFNEKGLEWMPRPTPKAGTGSYQGLGRYALDNAWRLDEVLRIAEANGVRLMYCIGTYGEFKDGGYFNEGSWVSNPYNAKNGGPCARPQDFWTDETARKLYKRRLRYLVARWGWSPFVFAWEFWNEVEPNPAVEAWTREMAAYLKEIDPNRRLVSTSYGSPPIWNDPNIDFSMTHMYGQAGNVLDFTSRIHRETQANLKFGKPYLLAEFGIDWQAGDQKWDPQGRAINMHNGAWTAIASGSAGTAMLWWWDSYVHPKDAYQVLTPVRKFTDSIDWANNPMKPVERIAVEGPADAPETFHDVTVSASKEWGRTPSNRHEVNRDGTLKGGPVAMTLGSPKRGGDGKELYSEVVWTLDMPQPGKVLVRIGEVCTSARLRIAVDGREAVNRALTTGEPGKGPWKSSRLLEPYKVWVASYDEDVAVEVPAGRHELSIANLEGDWLQVRSITVPSYRSSRFPDVDALAVAGDDLMVLWVHDRNSTWRDPYSGAPPDRWAGLKLTLDAPADSSWRVEWWDTFKGDVVGTVETRPESGRLTLRPPAFERDLAGKLVRVR
ncbi:glycoside hydrolase 5 family protein [Paludisphaera rhizosphaerae]|uniref:DUF5060 domain-containing protein n=1 Tax=Paludisphaera rhizosphaerae TaxID=2711216 RepID=UPI0013EA3A2F|nr:DUF5060 domain-containing protein [Paludisphaera rhizosphaerae]